MTIPNRDTRLTITVDGMTRAKFLERIQRAKSLGALPAGAKLTWVLRALLREFAYAGGRLDSELNLLERDREIFKKGVESGDDQRSRRIHLRVDAGLYGQLTRLCAKLQVDLAPVVRTIMREYSVGRRAISQSTYEGERVWERTRRATLMQGKRARAPRKRSAGAATSAGIAIS